MHGYVSAWYYFMYFIFSEDVGFPTLEEVKEAAGNKTDARKGLMKTIRAQWFVNPAKSLAPLSGSLIALINTAIVGVGTITPNFGDVESKLWEVTWIRFRHEMMGSVRVRVRGGEGQQTQRSCVVERTTTKTTAKKQEDEWRSSRGDSRDLSLECSSALVKGTVYIPSLG